ncbi:DegT/DnrJ/EryC1/StrS family aminotransferase [Chloroflexota bacterium]
MESATIYLPPPDIRWRACFHESAGIWDLLLGRVSNGNFTAWPQFENRDVIPSYQGSTAIFHMCEHFGLGDSAEVLIPAYNCGSEIDPFIYRGVQSTPYRVGLDTRIDFDDIQRKVTRKTKAIYVTHYFGWPQEMEPLLEFCKQNNILLLEDCALSLFSKYKNRPLGTIGDASIFSIRKYFPIPDGGALLINSSDKKTYIDLDPPPANVTRKDIRPLIMRSLSHTIAQMGLHGYKQWLKFRIRKPLILPAEEQEFPAMLQSKYYDPRKTYWSISRLSLSMLRRVDPVSVVQTRRANYKRLEENLADIQNVTPLYKDLPRDVCPLFFPVIVENRRKWVTALSMYGVGVYPFWMTYHPGVRWEEYPEARYLKDNVLTLPVHQQLTESHMDTIAEILRMIQRQVIR